MTEESALIEVKNLIVETPLGRILASDLNFTIEEGQAVFIQGGNGSGKTTLMRCLLGLWPHFSGSKHLRLSADSIAYLPQIQAPEVHMPLSLADVLSINSPELRTKDFLSVGLLEEKHLKYQWNTASGGEKQKTLLTRILLEEPRMIFLDEPFNHLDQNSYSLVIKSLTKFIEKGRGTIVMVSHETQSFGDFKNVPRQRILL